MSIEIVQCTTCERDHPFFIKIVKTSISKSVSTPKFFDSVPCAVEFLISSGWKQYKIITLNPEDIKTVLSTLNVKKQQMNIT